MSASRRGNGGTPRSPSHLSKEPNEGSHPYERLVDLLTRPGEQGGYGGRLTYSAFTALATSLGWNQEDMEDCWYDIVMGEPCAEARDMSRVAECVCSYCLASPLPLLEQYTASAKDRSRPSREPNFRPATPPSRTDAAAHYSTTVHLPPPTPPQPVVSTDVTTNVPDAPGTKQRTTSKTKRSWWWTSAGSFHRYAAATVSSERKRPSSLPSSLSRTAPSSRPSVGAATSPTPAPSPCAPVFRRLYDAGVEQQRKKATQYHLEASDDLAECTFRPKISSFHQKDAADTVAQYDRPTQSYFAKLTASERDDALRKEPPETPRVVYHPAPGPSAHVPAGYVEGVARLRHFVAERYAHTDLTGSLRSEHHPDVNQLADRPILRLPVTIDGAMEAVDVQLASPCRRRSPGQRWYSGPGRSRSAPHREYHSGSS